MVDNCKTAVLSHPFGSPAVLHPRYLDFASHYGFVVKACGPFKPHEKGRVENGVGYFKKNFLFNNDSTLTSAVLDRLLHHAETVILEGRSYRMKDQIETP